MRYELTTCAAYRARRRAVNAGRRSRSVGGMGRAWLHPGEL